MDLDFLLIRRMKSGEEEAFDIFVRKYYQDVLAYCSYHCMDQWYAPDLTQETFIRFFTALSSYRHKEKVKNYLYTIARNLCIDHVRKARDVPVPEEELTGQKGGEGQPEDKVLDRIVLGSALEKLPEEFKEVILLYYFEGLKIQEISEELGITVPLVKYRLRQAKRQLKELL